MPASRDGRLRQIVTRRCCNASSRLAGESITPKNIERIIDQAMIEWNRRHSCRSNRLQDERRRFNCILNGRFSRSVSDFTQAVRRRRKTNRHEIEIGP